MLGAGLNHSSALIMKKYELCQCLHVHIRLLKASTDFLEQFSLIV